MQPIKRHHIHHLRSLLSLLCITLIISRPLLFTSAQPPPQNDAQETDDAIPISNEHVAAADNNNEQRTSSSSKPKPNHSKQKRITLLGLDDILQLERSGIVGLGSSHNIDDDDEAVPHRLNYQELHNRDMIEDGFYDPFAADPSCLTDALNEENKEKKNVIGVNCWQPPESTVETEYVQVWEEDEEENEESRENEQQDEASGSAGLETLAWGYGGDDPDDSLLIEEEDEEEDGQQDDDNEKDADDQSDFEQQQENVDGSNQAQDECTATDVCGDNADELVDSSDDDDEATLPPSSSKADADTDADTDADNDKQSAAAASSKKKTKKKKGKKSKTILVDKHWGTDEDILKMRDRLRGSTNTNTNTNNHQSSDGNKNNNQRPPVFLLPGLASTRLVSWKHKPCPQSPLLSDIKMLDHVWLNMNLLIQMATIDVRCWSECMTLGRYQSDYDDEETAGSGEHVGSSNNSTLLAEESDTDKQQEQDGVETTRMHGCKLRPDEGLDSISSLAPGSISSNLLVGGTNTVYAWLIQWLADNLGYDVTSIVALPYDWRLSPDKMQSRDGFLTLMRKKIEAAVESNGLPGIMVAHSVSS